MAQFDLLMTEYVTKFLLLEGIKCYAARDLHGYLWIQKQLQIHADRWRELDDAN